MYNIAVLVMCSMSSFYFLFFYFWKPLQHLIKSMFINIPYKFQNNRMKIVKVTIMNIVFKKVISRKTHLKF